MNIFRQYTTSIHRAVNTVYFKSCDISAEFLRLKDIKLKTQQKCHRQNAENPAEMSRLSLKNIPRRDISARFSAFCLWHFRWVLSILSFILRNPAEMSHFQYDQRVQWAARSGSAPSPRTWGGPCCINELIRQQQNCQSGPWRSFSVII